MPKKLSARLRLIASMVPSGAYLADIGSDHAWLPIFLIESGKINWAMAIDNKLGPFMRMKDNVAHSGAANHIVCSHSDGISAIKDAVDTLAVCGLGGLLSCEILEARPEKLANIDAIIMDPHRDLIAVRRRVTELGFHIEDEEMVHEDRSYYTVIKFARGMPSKPYTPNELAFGPVLMKKKGPVYLEWLQAQKLKLKKLLNTPNLPDGKRNNYLATYRAVAAQIDAASTGNEGN